MGQEYTVIVEERALGVPLVGDPMARVTGVPIGIGQNLFTLFPLVQSPTQPTFTIHRQLLDLEESFYRAGYVLLDLRPQNIFYQPASGRITVIDFGALVGRVNESTSARRTPQDIHDFYLEMLKFYTTPQEPPTDVSGYREPYGLRPVIHFEQELEEMARRFSEMPAPSRDTALSVIEKVRNRALCRLRRLPLRPDCLFGGDCGTQPGTVLHRSSPSDVVWRAGVVPRRVLAAFFCLMPTSNWLRLTID